jgi:hypothetical protein
LTYRGSLMSALAQIASQLCKRHTRHASTPLPNLPHHLRCLLRARFRVNQRRRDRRMTQRGLGVRQRILLPSPRRDATGSGSRKESCACVAPCGPTERRNAATCGPSERRNAIPSYVRVVLPAPPPVPRLPARLDRRLPLRPLLPGDLGRGLRRGKTVGA